jgi:diguanylate cyclase (GGDEF)-like protein
LLQEQARQMQALSLTDELTRLHNRRGFLTLGEQQLRMAVRQKRPALIIFMDLDGLKGINDQLGNELGDAAIVETAKILRSTFRDVDMVARLGGDEFVAMMADTNAFTSVRRRLADAIASYNETTKGPFRISISAGAAAFDPAEPQGLENLVRQADAAMYEQKQRRRGTPSATNGSR